MRTGLKARASCCSSCCSSYCIRSQNPNASRSTRRRKSTSRTPSGYFRPSHSRSLNYSYSTFVFQSFIYLGKRESFSPTPYIII